MPDGSGVLDSTAYLRFLQSKFRFSTNAGFDVPRDAINPILKPHQADLVQWMVGKGRAACFARFGLGKSVIQLETCRLVLHRIGGAARALIVLPLGVRLEFVRDAEMLGVPVHFVRRTEEVDGPGIYLTNYESVRDGKLDMALFQVASLDEASVLRSYGSKTYQEFLPLFAGVQFRFVATATPSPNAYKELIHYAGFLGVMDTGQALTRFFQRDSEKANNLTIYPHMERELHLWLHSWAAFVQRPSDLGHSDEGYDLPPLDLRVHWVQAEQVLGVERNGQGVLVRDAALGLQDAAREKRDSIPARIAKLRELIAEAPQDHVIVWHDLEAERHAIRAAVPGIAEIYGTLDLDERERRTQAFADGDLQYVASKPELSGSGTNWQRHCHRAVFLGIGYKFNDLIQAIHRVQRYQQPHPVRIDLIVCETEREVWRTLQRKWSEHDALTERMSDLISVHGLATESIEAQLARTIGVTRREERGARFHVTHNDTVLECDGIEADSQDMILTSIPFGNHYEYSACYEDFGHNDDNGRFFEQMDHLTPNLLRILRPGRIAAVHVKDRVRFGNVTGYGMPSIEPFHADCIAHYRRHGFIYCGMITVVTDVVRENNQTYRLGWTEQGKDGTKMGVGCPEYVLLFRKLPTDTSRGYADVPVVKSKADYTRARWQIDAHAFWRSSGDRLLTASELRGYPADVLARTFSGHTLERIYDYRNHVEVAEACDRTGPLGLPSTFMAVAPGSHHPDVWHDVNRMRTLNGSQVSRNLTMHVCLAGGSLVLTKDGFKAIEAVEVGDLVLTHKGRWRPVLVKANTGVRPIVTVKAQGVSGLRLTPEHELWTRPVRDTPWARAHSRREAEGVEPCWTRADATPGSYVNLKLPPAEQSDLTTQEWWLVGRWLADGHVGTRGDYHVSIGGHKVEAFLAMAGDFVGPGRQGTATQFRLKCLSSRVSDMLARCGSGASRKVVPSAGLCLSKDLSAALLTGFLSGDGHYVEERQRWATSSVSRELLLGLAMVVQRTHGAIASIYAGRPGGQSIIQGREVTTLQDWVLCFDVPGDGTRKGRPFIAGDGAWKKVRSATSSGEVETWCLRVEEDESFTAEGCVVKNCPLQFDIVDRLIERFTAKGEQVFDPFGGLFTVPMRAMALGRRGRAVELNADYFRDGLRYCREAERDATAPTLFDFEGLAPAAPQVAAE